MVDAATETEENLTWKPSVPLAPSAKGKIKKACGIWAKKRGLSGVTNAYFLRNLILEAVDSIIEEEEGGLPLGTK